MIRSELYAALVCLVPLLSSCSSINQSVSMAASCADTAARLDAIHDMQPHVDRSQVRELLIWLTEDPDPAVRAAACSTLGAGHYQPSDTPRVALALVDRLDDDAFGAYCRKTWDGYEIYTTTSTSVRSCAYLALQRLTHCDCGLDQTRWKEILARRFPDTRDSLIQTSTR